MLLYRDQKPTLWLKSRLCGQKLWPKSAWKCGHSLSGMPPVHHRILIRGVRYHAILVVSSEGVVG